VFWVINPETMKLDDLLNQPLPCACGRSHHAALQTVDISSGALAKLPGLLNRMGYRRPFVIADGNTQAIAGKQLLSVLDRSNIPYASYVIDTLEVIPDEATLGSVLIHFDVDCDMIIAVGSGTINDICRFVSHRLARPYVIVATAPSMDGFASTVAPLITNHLKITFAAQIPRAIIADLDILTQAPLPMIAAGFGDVLGKYTCLFDWRLAALINSEYYCETIAQFVNLALQRTIAGAERILTREPAAIAQLTEALILVGIAMSYAGNSRPASGSEHHLSHFWEVRFLAEGKKAVLHGAKVGIATVIVLKLCEYLRAATIDIDRRPVRTVPPIDAVWEQEIKRVFKAAAPEVLLLEARSGKNSPAKHRQRLAAIQEHWQEIRQLLAALPSAAEAENLLGRIGGPVRPVQVGLDSQTVRDSVLYAKEIRDRYTVLQLLWDLELLEPYAGRVTAELYSNGRTGPLP
jgi:glycerol-1-phosphate dehydrogenase [NAD(P)+]